ncbi:hypothetical protein SAMN05216321_101151 [Cupriavidus sp. OV038]|uniref:hypothetical protein n=1 Tax=unclassified Cupriavidus TaxID=2640874 RepID=UPI0008EF9516|nr:MULTISPECIES: hypothetical protein [unclassified Cupriavidus]SFB69054.1 hypothetical protein SAMN05216321_101151 [Cupriavidus sp. OV038]SFO58453.1 hypothetical protein SAMN05216322_101151 [Cupriavidus sp. OV096]
MQLDRCYQGYWRNVMGHPIATGVSVPTGFTLPRARRLTTQRMTNAAARMIELTRPPARWIGAKP